MSDGAGEVRMIIAPILLVFDSFDRRYRSHLPASALPCNVVIPQAMTIVNSMHGYGINIHTTHTLYWTISATNVLVKIDGYTVSRAY